MSDFPCSFSWFFTVENYGGRDGRYGGETGHKNSRAGHRWKQRGEVMAFRQSWRGSMPCCCPNFTWFRRSMEPPRAVDSLLSSQSLVYHLSAPSCSSLTSLYLPAASRHPMLPTIPPLPNHQLIIQVITQTSTPGSTPSSPLLSCIRATAPASFACSTRSSARHSSPPPSSRHSSSACPALHSPRRRAGSCSSCRLCMA